jgi:uncharacterized protein
MSAAAENRPQQPRPVAIERYGKGGFRFCDKSQRRSLLCVPSGVWARPVAQTSDIDEVTLAQVFAEAAEIGLFLLGTGCDRWIMPDVLQDRFRALKINVEVARTGAAVSTYNILLGEGRRVAAGLVAVE